MIEWKRKIRRLCCIGTAVALLCQGTPAIPAQAGAGASRTYKDEAGKDTLQESRDDTGADKDTLPERQDVDRPGGNVTRSEEQGTQGSEAAEDGQQDENSGEIRYMPDSSEKAAEPDTEEPDASSQEGSAATNHVEGSEEGQPREPGVRAAGRADASGMCGQQVSWKLSGGTLTISGTGNMDNFFGDGSLPWQKYKESIVRVNIGEGVTSVGASAFYGFSKITDVVLPSTVTLIQSSAFAQCTSLKSITLPAALSYIWDAAFQGCSSLKKMTLPAALQKVGYLAFKGCASMQEFIVEEGNTYFLAENGVLFTIGKTELVAYPASSSMKSYTVPKQVGHIAAYGFEGCRNLETVTLPEGLESINEWMFYQCSNLKKVNLPSSIQSIRDWAFDGCYALKEIRLPSSLVEIGAYAFSECRLLSSITIPKGVKSIGDYAFQKCYKLREIDLPDTVASLGLSTFRFCRELERITVRNPRCEIQDVADWVEPQAVIYGKKNSTAQGYAKKYKRVFQEIGSKPVKKITVNKKKLSLKIGKTASLKAKISPSDATSKKVTWISSNPSIASVSSKGKVKARMDGRVTIMAKSSNGKLASCTVTVLGKNRKVFGSVNTASRQDYTVYSSMPLSGLTLTASGYMAVTAIEKSFSYKKGRSTYRGTCYESILAEYYNKSFRRTSKKKIPMELSKYGGFYAGKDAYFLVFGQDNPKDNDDVEVLRVVKYNKKWKRLGAASLRGADTNEIFHAGNLRMEEYEGRLIIRTAHTMYSDASGVHHQGTLTVSVDMSDLENIVWYDYDISHSFNQFIMLDDKGHLVTLDHGDANPRSAVLKEYNAKELAYGLYEDLYFESDRIHTLEYPSYKKIHYNNTGAAIGGLSYSSGNYLTAGCSVAHNKKFEKNNTRNVYITVTPRGQVSTKATKLKWITSYKEGGKVAASAPQLVKLSKNSFLLLWERISRKSGRGKVSYVFLDGNGKKTSKVYTKKGYLSDCQPIVSKGSAVWYVKLSGKTIFYKVKKNGEFKQYK